MNLLLVVRWPVGGIRTFINYIYTQHKCQNISLHILVPNITEIQIMQQTLAENNIVWHVLDAAQPTPLQILRRTRNIIKTHKIDVLHAHGFTSAICISPIAATFKGKAIFTSHDVLNQSQFLGAFGLLKKVIITFALNRFHVIHSVSNDASNNLLQFLPRINRGKCITIPNGIDSNRFYTAHPAATKEIFGIPSSVILIGFFGRFMSQKGFKYLIEAIEILELSHTGVFKVACFGAGAYIREEKAAIEKKKLSHCFYFHDSVPDISSYLKGCDIVAMPSLWEACGLLAMEAMVSGVRLVASNCIGLREVCSGTPAITVPPMNSRALADGLIIAQATDSTIFQQFALEAYKKFDINDTREKIFSLYH
jgi:glycosyltransferase involved in cell wall biosynthesis